MNSIDWFILNEIIEHGYKNQRDIATRLHCSLGSVNNSIKLLRSQGLLDEEGVLTDKGAKLAKTTSPQNAVILAAGYGMRMVPINMDVPKGLVEVNGEPLIERLIRQLHEKGIRDIYVVVGFLKEKYEYLIDQFGVQLVTNSDYSQKNNLHSLHKVVDKIGNSYVIPCDVWCKYNPFRKNETISWYMVSTKMTDDSQFRVNRKYELVRTREKEPGNDDIGIAYISSQDAACLRDRIEMLCSDFRFDGAFWESALEESGRYSIAARVENAVDVVEINTYLQLEELNHHFNELSSDAKDKFCNTLVVSDVENAKVIKSGITNHTFLITCTKGEYTMRIPNKNTHPLINRMVEAEVYKVTNDSEVCEHPIYFDVDTGYKISTYHKQCHICDVQNEDDVTKCLDALRTFHRDKRKIAYDFNIIKQLNKLEELFLDKKSVFNDYQKTKSSVLKAVSNATLREKELSCVDCTPDNFLILEDGSVEIIDWENASMQDPRLDFAMFCVNGKMDADQIERYIDYYFDMELESRKDIYAFIALAGLFWSNWCEYNYRFGVDFGEYSLLQYRYAKVYARKSLEESENKDESLRI